MPYTKANKFISDEAVERVAKALANSRGDGIWDQMEEETRDFYRADAEETIHNLPHLLNDNERFMGGKFVV